MFSPGSAWAGPHCDVLAALGCEGLHETGQLARGLWDPTHIAQPYLGSGFNKLAAKNGAGDQLAEDGTQHAARRDEIDELIHVEDAIPTAKCARQQARDRCAQRGETRCARVHRRGVHRRGRAPAGTCDSAPSTARLGL